MTSLEKRVRVQLVGRIVERLREYADELERQFPSSVGARWDAASIRKSATTIETEFGGEMIETRKPYTPPTLTPLTPAETITVLEAACARLEKELAAERAENARIRELVATAGADLLERIEALGRKP